MEVWEGHGLSYGTSENMKLGFTRLGISVFTPYGRVFNCLFDLYIMS